MKKTALYLVASVSVVMILFFNGSSKDMLEGYSVGDEARDFSLENIDGQMVSLADFENAKGFVVVFTCNTCPYAKAYESRVIELDKKYAAKGFPVIAINPNDVNQQPGDSMDEMIARADDKGYTFPYLRDDTQEITRAYGATKTPHVYVLNKEGSETYRVSYIGAIDDSPREPADVKEKYVEEAIEALLAGEKPVITEKRAIGCSIKWADS
jgi:peroxiredoxin